MLLTVLSFCSLTYFLSVRLLYEFREFFLSVCSRGSACTHACGSTHGACREDGVENSVVLHCEGGLFTFVPSTTLTSVVVNAHSEKGRGEVLLADEVGLFLPPLLRLVITQEYQSS